MITNEKYNLPDIVSQFQVDGTISSIKTHGSGHINDSFYLQNKREDSPDYLLQRINSLIFKDVPALMENISSVIKHLKKKLEDVPGSEPEKHVLTLVKTIDDLFYYEDSQGNFWRMYHYLKNTRSFDVIEDTTLAYEGGKAFGRFQSQLIDMDIQSLHETIPDFHNVCKRVADFEAAILNDISGRRKDVALEIDFLTTRSEGMIRLSREGVERNTFKRITHNDTKFNNLLLNKDNKVECVVDLDTVMPGFLAYDFGDAIRTLINTAAEDEADLGKVNLNIPLFKAYTRGYLEEAAGFISPEEIKSLSLGMLMLPYMQSVRFLTDYLNGDVYYKILFPDHNLQRTRAQSALLRKLELNIEELEAIIQESAIVSSR
jgi:hypothetical protein